MKTPVQICPTTVGAVTATTEGTTVTSGGSIGAYGTNIELVASTDYDSCGFFVSGQFDGSSGAALRIFMGPSTGTEIAELMVQGGATDTFTMYVPICVPAGTRLSAAVASANTTTAASLAITLVRGRNFDPLVSKGTLIGWTSGTGAFTDVDAGGTANTKGSWVPIIASTARDAKGYTLCLLGDTSSDTNVYHLWDIGVGAASSEQVIFSNLFTSQEGFRVAVKPGIVGPIWTPIPAGTRIAARVQCSSNSAVNRVPRVAIILWE